jgi:ketosteroid isomerase-like protein
MRHLLAILITGSLLTIACDQLSTTKDNITKSEMERDAIVVIKKLNAAMNAHNLNAMLDCVDPDYISEQPFYPDRNFAGREKMQKNWSSILGDHPDFTSDLKSYSVSYDTIWAEWHWTGTQEDSTRLNMVGVTIFRVERGHITKGRLFMESVE